MALCSFLRIRRPSQFLFQHRERMPLLPLQLLLMALTITMVILVVAVFPSWIGLQFEIQKLELAEIRTSGTGVQVNVGVRNRNSSLEPGGGMLPVASLPQQSQKQTSTGPYHDWELFAADYQEMLKTMKIFVYPDISISNKSSPFAQIFLPHPNPFDRKLGNYFSEHAFKIALLQSSLLTRHPEEASFFFMPFSINAMRNHPRLRSESSIPDFIAQYTTRISSGFPFWNASGGADHFFVCCHSVGREAASKHPDLHNNAIQITCSSSYFQRLYIAHKDIGLPQVWPRQSAEMPSPPDARDRLVFFSGRLQNSHARQELFALWQNDTSFHIFPGNPSISYEEGFRRSRYCLHVKGYEVNTARISDAIHYGCIPVIISNYYDLPYANILDWTKFSIIIHQRDVPFLRDILLSVSKETYLSLYENLCIIRKHFKWHTTPRDHDSFYMTAYQLWVRRGLHRLSK